MTIPVQDVAKFIIQKSDRISNLKLQKLLYYVQGWHLGLAGKPLFTEEIQAWVHGPVVPPVFREYRVYRWHDIEKPSETVFLSTNAAKHTLEVLKVYGKYSGDQLVRLSHSEEPWKKARQNKSPDEACTNAITHSSMRAFFASRAKA